MTQQQLDELKKILVLHDRTGALLNINHEDNIFSLVCYFFVRDILTDISVNKNLSKGKCRFITKRKAEIVLENNFIDIFNMKIKRTNHMALELDKYFTMLKTTYAYLLLEIHDDRLFFLTPKDKTVTKSILNKLIEWEMI